MQPEYPGNAKCCLKYAKMLETEPCDTYEAKEDIHDMICEIYFSHSLCLKLEKKLLKRDIILHMKHFEIWGKNY